MTVIELDRVTLAVAGRPVLSQVSLSIAAGEFIGVLGPNGAGKTTLMRAILGLIKPQSGTLRVFGKAPRRGNATVGYMPQLRTLLPDLRMRGRDMIASSLDGERWGLPIPSRRHRRMIDAMLEAAGARELAERPLADMSGGERQRLLLAQALMGEPKLLLLDEPLISLDASHQRRAVELVRDFARARGITVLFSAHELNQLLGAIDRVLYLGGGGAALGTVEEVVTAPVLSRLFGSDIDVIRAGGHVFVMSHGSNVEREAHGHDHAGEPGHGQAGHRHDHAAL